MHMGTLGVLLLGPSRLLVSGMLGLGSCWKARGNTKKIKSIIFPGSDGHIVTYQIDFMANVCQPPFKQIFQLKTIHTSILKASDKTISYQLDVYTTPQQIFQSIFRILA